MKPLQVLAIVWLVVVGAGLYGMKAAEQGWWPYPTLKEVEAFLAGNEEESTTLTEKVQNDLGLLPARHLVPPPNLEGIGAGYEFIELDVSDRRAPPVMMLADDAPYGYRVIYGVFDLPDALHAAILIDPEGQVQRVWPLSQEDVDWAHPADANVFPHGFEILKDGSIIVAYDHGTSMTRYDYCGNALWQVMGGFHHSIDLVDEDSFWVWGNDGQPSQFGNIMHEVAVADGSIRRSISITDMIDSNPEIDIFGIRQADEQAGSRFIITGGGAWHQNDIDPLPASLADQYPQFEAGDLLVSMRSPNLVYVVDPETVRVKWWRQGLTRRQHDPDWNDRGTITIFDNNMHRGFSHIVEIDPVTMESRRILNGERYSFYTWHRGKHQQLDSGHLLVTSAAQGRVFEAAPDGSLTFDFLNLYAPEHGALVLSEARFLPADYFEDLPTCEP